MILTITYDLHNPGRDYEDVIKTIKSASSWAHPQGSVWLVDTVLSASDWVDKLRKAGDPNDELFVSRMVTKDWAAFNTDQNVVDWLKSSSRNW